MKNNSRDRSYNKQQHTFQGIRGSQKIENITLRDIADCMVQGLLVSTGDDELYSKTFEIDTEFKGTEYSSKGTWKYNDLYEIDWNNIDPIAVIQNTLCFVEHYMGIFPNIKKSYNNEEDTK